MLSRRRALQIGAAALALGLAACSRDPHMFSAASSARKTSTTSAAGRLTKAPR